MAITFDIIQRNSRISEETDRQMSRLLVLIYLLPIIALILSVAFTLVSVLSIISANNSFTSPYDFIYTDFATEFAILWIMFFLTFAINFVVQIVFTYLLVKRYNTHITRHLFLSENIITKINSLSEKKGVDVEASLFSIKKTAMEANEKETKKDAVLWAVLSAFIPFLSWYVYYFLMKDFYNHEHREDGFWQDLKIILKKLGTDFSVSSRIGVIPNRSFPLYLTLTIVTVGLFGIYWIFVLLRDPNEHFKYHVQVEKQLLATLESATS
jgi:hypothetical protein